MSMTFKKICRLAGNAIVDYHMIEDGDKILVGVSGGKDSMILLKVLKHLSNAAPVRFTLYAATFDPGFAGFSTDGTASYCESLGIPHHAVNLNIPRLLQEKHLTTSPVCSVRGCAGEICIHWRKNWVAIKSLWGSISTILKSHSS